MSGAPRDSNGAGTSAPETGAPSYRRVLTRVMAVQVVALLLLWLLQARYGG